MIDLHEGVPHSPVYLRKVLNRSRLLPGPNVLSLLEQAEYLPAEAQAATTSTELILYIVQAEATWEVPAVPTLIELPRYRVVRLYDLACNSLHLTPNYHMARAIQYLLEGIHLDLFDYRIGANHNIFNVSEAAKAYILEALAINPNTTIADIIGDALASVPLPTQPTLLTSIHRPYPIEVGLNNEQEQYILTKLCPLLLARHTQNPLGTGIDWILVQAAKAQTSTASPCN